MALVTAAALVAAIPAGASADTYSVYSCRTPAGTVAARDGWVPFQVAGASTATDTCAANGALMGNMAPSAAGNSASWTVAAPPGLPITGYVLYRWAQVTNVARLWARLPVHLPAARGRDGRRGARARIWDWGRLGLADLAAG